MTAPDPLGLQRRRHAENIERAERSLFAVAWDVLKEWAAKLRRAVLGRSGVPDVSGVWSTEQWFDHQLDDVLVEVREVVDWAAHDVLDHELPPGNHHRGVYLDQARNRLARVPDSVFASINRMTMAATTEGWSVDELAGKIDELLAATGSERWRNRAETIARTEAVGAYNAGTLAGFHGLARSLGGDWEKAWLATEDARTRPSHRIADLQRVPLAAPFAVGGFPGQFPGDPELPGQEVINCRCSLLLVRPGEEIDYSDRQFRR